MATSSKKTTSKDSSSAAPAKWPFAKTAIAPTPAKKVSAPKTEKLASKPAAIEKSIPKKSVKKITVTPEERYHMIATAAYFRGEQRGFSDGCEKEDWISAEAQIDTMLNA